MELYGKYDTFRDNPRIYVKVTFPKDFVKALTKAVSEPTISVVGTYKVMHQVVERAGLAGSNAFPNARGETHLRMINGRMMIGFARAVVPVREGANNPPELYSVANQRENWIAVDNSEVAFAIEGML